MTSPSQLSLDAMSLARSAMEEQAARIALLEEAVKRLCGNFPTDIDMDAAGWATHEINSACDAYDFARSVLNKERTMADLTLTDSEQREIFRNPEALMVLMTYHDIQQDQADSMGAECYGNKLRYEELKAHGKPIVEQDPAIWSNDVLARVRTVHSLMRPSEGGYPMRSCQDQGQGTATCLAASRASLYGIWIWIRSAFQVRKK
jgi:hypothetical protein